MLPKKTPVQYAVIRWRWIYYFTIVASLAIFSGAFLTLVDREYHQSIPTLLASLLMLVTLVLPILATTAYTTSCSRYLWQDPTSNRVYIVMPIGLSAIFATLNFMQLLQFADNNPEIGSQLMVILAICPFTLAGSIWLCRIMVVKHVRSRLDNLFKETWEKHCRDELLGKLNTTARQEALKLSGTAVKAIMAHAKKLSVDDLEQRVSQFELILGLAKEVDELFPQLRENEAAKHVLIVNLSKMGPLEASSAIYNMKNTLAASNANATVNKATQGTGLPELPVTSLRDIANTVPSTA